MPATPNRSMGIVKYPCHIGQEKPGVEKTPDILPKSLQPYIEKNHMLVQVYDSDDIRKQDSKAPQDENAIFQANLALRQLIVQSIQKHTKTLNIGGDHTMGLGTVSAFLECFAEREAMVIWIDAHADVNTREASNSNHYHGMPVAFLLGIDKDEKFPIKTLLKPHQLIYVGLRDVDEYEKNEVISKYNIRCISVSQMAHRTLDALVAEYVGEHKCIHISWDVDSTNPETEVSSTGTTAKGGLTSEQVKAFIHTVAKQNQIVSLDVTELNLDLGTAEEQQRSLDKTVDVIKSYIDC